MDNLMQRLMELDFTALDLWLYLDTHPGEANALADLHTTLAEADKVRAEYEKRFGPLDSFRSHPAENKFNWPEEPWPWQNQ